MPVTVSLFLGGNRVGSPVLTRLVGWHLDVALSAPAQPLGERGPTQTSCLDLTGGG